MSAVQKDRYLVEYKVGDESVKLSPTIVKDYLTNGKEITMPEFKMFTELCKTRKLNPFLKEAYIIKYGNSPAQIVTGKDAILKRAINHNDFNGRQQGIIIVDEDGGVVYRNGTFKLKKETLVGGWAKVYRKNWEHPTEVTVSFDEVAQRKTGGELNSNWASKGATMVEKVALVRALRETFVEEIGGMIDESESWSNETLDRQSHNEVKEQKDTFSNEPANVETIDTEIDFDAV